MTDSNWKLRFLEVLASGNTVEMAARSAGVHRVTAYRHRKEEPEFAAQWDQALESGSDMLEEIAIARARQHSDMLLMFLLKARRPDRFIDRQRLEHVKVDYRDAQEELEAMARRILKEGEDEEQEVKRLSHVDHED
jgi:hypothetical protein